MNTEEYDYVIVGAGSAGCVLANRLSADGVASVLLLEAGGWDHNPWIHIPLGWPKLLTERMNDWMYFSGPEVALDNREIECARGKVIGGSSSINAMAYVRGHRGDFDRWAETGLAGWSFDAVLPYFRKQESWEDGSSPMRGGDGPVTTQFSRYPDPISEGFMLAGDQAGHPYTPDYNGEEQHGFGRWQSSIRDGRRCSASTAYLKPVLKRRNLVLRLGAHATKVELSGGVAHAIHYRRGNSQHRAVARREVLLCGGVINSPQLLMLSGIGQADALRALGLAVEVDLPGVGENLRDHISAGVGYERTPSGPLHRAMRADRIVGELGNTYFRGKGIANDLPAGGMAFLKSEEAGALPDVQLICIAAPMTAHPYLAPIRKPYRDGYAIRAAVLRPESRGTVRLASADPFAAPRIVQNFLATDKDWRTLRAGLRLARHVGSRAALASFGSRELFPASDQSDDLDAHIRKTGISVHHPLGTCRMGIDGDPMAVLDGKLKVRGVERLRVVDASAMPDMIGGNINAAVMMIAEKAADMILKSAG